MLVVQRETPAHGDKTDPNFQYGVTQAYVALAILVSLFSLLWNHKFANKRVYFFSTDRSLQSSCHLEYNISLQIISFVVTSVALIVSTRIGARRLNIAATFRRAAASRNNQDDESASLLNPSGERSNGDLATAGARGGIEDDEAAATESLVPIEDLMHSSSSDTPNRSAQCSTQCCAMNPTTRSRLPGTVCCIGSLHFQTKRRIYCRKVVKVAF